MLDNQIIALVISILNAGSTAAGVPGLLVKQSYQPTQQGANSAPTVYLNPLFDEVIGSPLREDQWNEMTSTMDHVESQQMGTHFQLTALATQNPADVNSLTAKDILNKCRYILQSDVGIQSFQNANTGIQRITAVRNTPFQDDRQRWEYQPSFDFIITHKQIIESATPIVEATELAVYEV